MEDKLNSKKTVPDASSTPISSGVAVDFWSIESQVYPKLDAMSKREETIWKENFDLGANQKLGLHIKSKNNNPISLHQPCTTEDISFSMDFRSGNDNWFRVDNQGGHGYLHFHLESGGQQFNEQIPIPETHSVSGLVSYTFTRAEEIIRWKFPEFIVGTGSGFVGTA